MTPNELIESQIKALTIYDANNTCMSITQCAKFLGLERRTISAMIVRKEIKAKHLSNRTLIPKIQFLEILI